MPKPITLVCHNEEVRVDVGASESPDVNRIYLSVTGHGQLPVSFMLSLTPVEARDLASQLDFARLKCDPMRPAPHAADFLAGRVL